MVVPVDAPMAGDGRALLLLGVWVMLFAAFAIVQERAMKRLRAHRVRRPARAPVHPAWGILTRQSRAHDPERYDDEGKRILQQLHARTAVLVATWIAAGLIYAFTEG